MGLRVNGVGEVEGQPGGLTGGGVKGERRWGEDTIRALA